jgi:hypothetical protein
MVRGPVLLSVFALGLIQPRAPAVELPVITNGTQVAQAPKPEAAPPPAPADKRLPVIINYPSALSQPAPADAPKSNVPLPVITNLSPAVKPARPVGTRVVLPLDVAAYADDVGPVAYNVYGTGWVNGYYGGWGAWPYAGYGWCDWCGYGYPVAMYGAPLPWTPWGVGLVPPRVEVLDTGVRANIGHLTSLPSVRSPVYGAVLGVYRVRR